MIFEVAGTRSLDEDEECKAEKKILDRKKGTDRFEITPNIEDSQTISTPSTQEENT